MKYKYLKEVESEQHLLFHNEVAQMLGIMTEKGAWHSKLIAAIENYYEEYFECAPTYYQTKHGLRRVCYDHLWISKYLMLYSSKPTEDKQNEYGYIVSVFVPKHIDSKDGVAFKYIIQKRS